MDTEIHRNIIIIESFNTKSVTDNEVLVASPLFGIQCIQL